MAAAPAYLALLHLDQLAREGTRFASAFTVAPICTPSRYSFFTGRYAHVHGATDNSTPTREPQLLLPAILKHAGYQTAISGKLHFIPANLDFSFDYFWSFTGEGPRKLPTWLDDMEKKHGRGAARRLEIQPFPDDALGRDLGKLTYPAVHGIDGSRREVERLRLQAVDAIAPLGARAERLTKLVEFLASRTK